MPGIKIRENQISTPVWIGDYLSREHLVPHPAKLDPAQFTNQGGILVTVGAAAGAGAVAVTVTVTEPQVQQALPTVAVANSIPKGTTLYLGGAKVMTLTADLKVGDVSASVAALPTALAGGETVYFDRFGRKFIPSGTLVGRTFAERAANADYGPADVATPDDEIFLIVNDVIDANENSDVELYRHQGLVKENYLPGYAALSGAALAKIRALYRTTTGVD